MKNIRSTTTIYVAIKSIEDDNLLTVIILMVAMIKKIFIVRRKRWKLYEKWEKKALAKNYSTDKLYFSLDVCPHSVICLMKLLSSLLNTINWMQTNVTFGFWNKRKSIRCDGRTDIVEKNSRETCYNEQIISINPICNNITLQNLLVFTGGKKSKMKYKKNIF